MDIKHKSSLVCLDILTSNVTPGLTQRFKLGKTFAPTPPD